MTVVTSSDGRVKATTEPTFAGIKLTLNFSGASPVPWLITATRKNNVTNVTETVRSGDLVTAPGGVAFAYDHEAPLGTSVTYQATAYDYLGVLKHTSTTATITTEPTAPVANKVWIKSLEEPSLSLSLVEESFTYDAERQQQKIVIPGRKYPVVYSEPLGGAEGELAVLALGIGQITPIRSLMNYSLALIQHAPGLEEPDMYVRFGALNERPVGPRLNGTRRASAPFIQVDRPATTGADTRMPGMTWTSVVATYATGTAMTSANATNLALLGG